MTRERQRVERGLARIQDLEAFPSVTNFVLFRHRSRPPAELHAAILEHGVLVRDVSMWPGADRCLRVTIGTESENTRFLAAIERATSVVRA
jgi:histidinol-phosphate/aromatic aminotransferase/cobyric acid decarboxylase-like protein